MVSKRDYYLYQVLLQKRILTQVTLEKVWGIYVQNLRSGRRATLGGVLVYGGYLEERVVRQCYAMVDAILARSVGGGCRSSSYSGVVENSATSARGGGEGCASPVPVSGEESTHNLEVRGEASTHCLRRESQVGGESSSFSISEGSIGKSSFSCVEDLGSVSDTIQEAPSVDSQKKLGEYLIVRELGRGGMGVVYEGYQPALQRKVAIKVLSQSLVHNKEAVERFWREAKAVAQLSHPNIVSIYSLHTEGDLHYFAMEYIEGRPLSEILQEKWLSPKVAVNYILQACRALEYAHSRGIVHRDIKPSNMMVTKEDQLLLTDFGLVRLQNETQQRLTVSGAILGTPSYMSPEQVLGELDRIDHRTDIYSLGVSLYELLTQRLPFQGDSAQSIMLQILERYPKSPKRLNSRLSRDLETIILRAMDKDPSRRYQSAKEMAEDLERYQQNLPIVAKISPWEKAKRFLATNKKVVSRVAVLLFLGMILVGLWLQKRSKERIARLERVHRQSREKIERLKIVRWIAKVEKSLNEVLADSELDNNSRVERLLEIVSQVQGQPELTQKKRLDFLRVLYLNLGDFYKKLAEESRGGRGEEFWRKSFHFYQKYLGVAVSPGAFFYYKMAFVQRKLGKGGFVEYLQKALKRNPSFPPALMDLGNYYYSEGRYDLAQGLFKRFVQLKSPKVFRQKWLAHYRLFEIAMRGGRYGDAFSHLEVLEKKYPKVFRQHPRTYSYKLGFVLYRGGVLRDFRNFELFFLPEKVGFVQGVLGELNAYLRKNPKNPLASLLRGLIYRTYPVVSSEDLPFRMRWRSLEEFYRAMVYFREISLKLVAYHYLLDTEIRLRRFLFDFVLEMEKVGWDYWTAGIEDGEGIFSLSGGIVFPRYKHFVQIWSDIFGRAGALKRFKRLYRDEQQEQIERFLRDVRILRLPGEPMEAMLRGRPSFYRGEYLLFRGRYSQAWKVYSSLGWESLSLPFAYASQVIEVVRHLSSEEKKGVAVVLRRLIRHYKPVFPLLYQMAHLIGSAGQRLRLYLKAFDREDLEESKIVCFQNALRYFKKGLSYFRRAKIRTTYRNIGENDYKKFVLYLLQALDYFQQVSFEVPSYSLAYFYQALCHLYLGRFRCAERNLERVLEIHPNFIGAYILRAILEFYFSPGSPKAEDRLSKSMVYLQKGWKILEGILRRVKISELLSAKIWKKQAFTLAFFQILFALKSKDSVLQARSRVLLKTLRRFFPEEKGAHDRLYRLSTGKRVRFPQVFLSGLNSWMFYLAAIHRRKVADMGKALRFFELSLDIDPYYEPNYFSRSEIYIKRNRFGLAFLEYGRGLEIDPRYVYKIYDNLDLKDRYPQTVIQFFISTLKAKVKELIRTHPRNSTGYFLTAFVAYLEKKNKKMREYLQRAMEINPRTTAFAYCLLGRIEYEGGRYNKAIEYFNGSLREFRRHYSELNEDYALAYLWRAMAELKLKQVERALQSISQAVYWGFDKNVIRGLKEFRDLRQNPRFQTVLK